MLLTVEGPQCAWEALQRRGVPCKRRMSVEDLLHLIARTERTSALFCLWFCLLFCPSFCPGPCGYHQDPLHSPLSVLLLFRLLRREAAGRPLPPPPAPAVFCAAAAAAPYPHLASALACLTCESNMSGLAQAVQGRAPPQPGGPLVHLCCVRALGPHLCCAAEEGGVFCFTSADLLLGCAAPA